MAVTAAPPASPAAPPAPPPKNIVIGAPRQPLRDAYHALLRLPWSVTLAVIAVGYLAVNVAFALAYWATGGVSNVHGFVDDFYFSVQTSATIGYGGMTPTTDLANTLMVAEGVVSLILTAVATGLVFSKFSRSTARMRFSRHAVIIPFDGVPTLMFRLGNERGNAIVEARFYVTLSRMEVTREGERFYRQYDLPLARDRAPALSRTWTVMHPITEWSPLHGETPASLAAAEGELFVSVMGTDDTTAQTVFAGTTYDAADVAWGHRMCDVLEVRADGGLTIDLRRFDAIEPASPTETFPYPAPAATAVETVSPEGTA